MALTFGSPFDLYSLYSLPNSTKEEENKDENNINTTGDLLREHLVHNVNLVQKLA